MDVVASTYPRRYEDVPPGTELKVHVWKGYKPNALLLVERKIYAAHRLSVHGRWRRSGRITVEVQDWRHHEADWFAAMQGATLEISDPGRSDVRNEESEYVISKSSFDEKIVKLPDAQVNKAEVRMYVGTLDGDVPDAVELR